MSKKKLSLRQKLEQLYYETNDVKALLHGLKGKEAVQMYKDLENAAAFIRRILDGQDTTGRSGAEQCQARIRAGFIELTGYYNGLTGKDKRSLAPTMKSLRNLAVKYTDSNTGVMKDLYKLLDTVGRERKTYSDTNGGDLLTFERPYSPGGRAPGVQQLREMHIPGSDPERVFEALVWLGQKAAMARQVEADISDIWYQQQYERLMAELNDAPLELQFQYVRMFNRQEIMNRDKLAAQQADQPEQDLTSTALFYQAQAFHLMCRDIKGTVGTMICLTQQPKPANPYVIPRPAIADRHKEIGALLDTPVSEAHKALIRRELAPVYLDSTFTRQTQRLLEELDEIKVKPSPTFTAMARMLTDFARENHDEIADEGRYLKRLTACERTARQYALLHNKKNENDPDSSEYKFAQSIIILCTRTRNALLQKGSVGADRRASAMKFEFLTARFDYTAAKPKPHVDELLTLARLQKSAITGSIHPRVRNENPPVSRMHRFFRGLGHAMGSIFSGLAAVTIGLPGNIAGMALGTYNYILKAPIRALINGRIRTTVSNVVPGERDQRLQARLSDAVDPSTGVLTDIRRIPLVWEQPIPDDPLQPPTVSFRVRQPRTGSAISEVLEPQKNGSATTSTDSGHSHICIRYSKRDPITGRLQRYESTFGFFGKGGFWDRMNEAAMAQVGYRIPGQINRDGGTYSAEKTVEVNAQQLNQLIRYTQVYENGGYNMFERNCTTFLADSAKAMGIDLSDLFKKVDITSESNQTRFGHLWIPMAGTLLIAANAERHAMNMANRNDLSYQRMGQRMVGGELFDRETHRTHNLRMAGYTPGAVGQAIRADAGFSIRNYDDRQLTNGQEIIKTATDNLFAGSHYNFNLPIMAREYGFKEIKSGSELRRKRPIQSALLGLEYLMANTFTDDKTYMQNREDDPKVMSDLISRITEYSENMIEAMKRYAGQATAEDARDRSDEEAAALGSKLADEYIEAMDRFFAVNFRSDADMLEPFRDLAAMAQEVKSQFDARYRVCKYAHDKEAFMSGNKLSDTRDTAGIIKSFFDADKYYLEARQLPGKEPVSGELSLSQTMAALRVYGSLEQYLKDIKQYTKLQNTKKRTSRQQKEYARIRARLDAVSNMEDSLRYMPMKKHYNDSNLNLLFNTLPANAQYAETAGENDPIRMLQCMAYEHIFHGILKDIAPVMDEKGIKAKNTIEAYSGELRNLKEDIRIYNEDVSKRFPKGNIPIQVRKEKGEYIELKNAHIRQCSETIMNARQDYLDTAALEISKAFQHKLNSLTPQDMQYLRKIQTCIAQRMYANELKKDKTQIVDVIGRRKPAEYYAEQAAKEIIETLAGTYTLQTCHTLLVKTGLHNDILSEDTHLCSRYISETVKIPDFLKAPLTGLTQKENPDLKAAEQPNPMLP